MWGEGIMQTSTLRPLPTTELPATSIIDSMIKDVKVVIGMNQFWEPDNIVSCCYSSSHSRSDAC